MRKLLTSVALTFVAVAVAPAFEAEVTIRGEVVDVSCAISKESGGRGDAHAACALACARKGQPVGVMTADAIYELTGDYAAGNNARLLDFIAKQVTVTGELSERDGRKLVNVRSIALAR
jgi:hypothetical protein